MTGHKLLTLAILTALNAHALAQNAEPVVLDTLFIQTQRNYDAQATETGREYTTPTVTVGTQIPAAMRDIPQSVSIITHQHIQDRDSHTLDQLARKTPGLRVLSNDDGRSSVYARGYEYDEANIDGLPAPMQSINGTLPNLVAFDRVEIMRGPNGLFDSSGEMGGIVNLVRKRPADTFQAGVNGGYGSRQSYQAGADLSAPLNADGSLRGRIILDTNGKSPKPAKDNNHHETLYSALDWQLSENTTLGIGHLYQQRQITPDNGLAAYDNKTLLPLPQNTFMGAPWNTFDMQSHDLFLDGKHYFANGAYGKIGLRYSDRKADSNYAFGGSAIKRDDNTLRASGLATDIAQSAFALDASYSQPFQWGNMNNEYVVGLDYNHFNTRNEQGRTTLNNSLTPQQFSSLPHTDILANARAGAPRYNHTVSQEKLDETGTYGKITLRPTDNLSLIGGARLGHYALEAGNGKTRQKRSDTFFTGYGGIVWDFTPNNSLYASYSSLYRPQTALDTQNRLLKPRKGSQIEIGYKGSYLNDRLNTRVSLYRLEDKNAAAALPDNTTQYAALGKRVMQGVETEISGALTDHWNIHAGYSYLDSTIKTASTGRDDGIFLLMPRHTFNLWSTYDINDRLTLGGGINAMSHITSSQGLRAPGYSTIDLMAGYRVTPALQLQLNIDNVLNRKYYTRIGSTNTFNLPGAERSIMAKVRYDFR